MSSGVRALVEHALTGSPGWQDALRRFVVAGDGVRREAALRAIPAAITGLGIFTNRGTVMRSSTSPHAYVAIHDPAPFHRIPPVLDVIERSYGIDRVISRHSPDQKPPRADSYSVFAPPSDWGVHVTLGRHVDDRSVGLEVEFELREMSWYLHDRRGLSSSGLNRSVWPFLWYVIYIERLASIARDCNDRPHISIGALGYDGR